MKTNTLKSLLLLTTLFSITFLSSCEDDDKSPVANDPEKMEVVDKVLAFRDDLNFINRFVEENVDGMSSEEGGKSSAKTIIAKVQEVAPCTDATEEEFPDGSLRISLNFGEGCETEDGIIVAGQVVMNFSFSEGLIEYSLEFTDYQEIGSGEHPGEVANGTVTGRFVFDFENGTFSQEMEQDLTITYENNTQATYHIAQQAEMTENGLRVTELKTSGNFADGGQFAVTVAKALIYDFSCDSDLPVQGEELLVFQGNTIRVNYGNGTCDSSYTVK